MTDPKKPNDFDIAFDDLDDMLGEWEQGVDAGKARPESAPMPQAKPLYRPPAPGEVTPPPRPAHEYHVGFDEDDDDGATRIAQVPRELIAALLAKKREEPATVPPPAPASTSAREPADEAIGGRVTMPTPELGDEVDWDLDNLLSEPPGSPKTGPTTMPPGPPSTTTSPAPTPGNAHTRRPPSGNEPRPRSEAHSRESMLEIEEEEAFFAQLVKAPPAPAVPTFTQTSPRSPSATNPRPLFTHTAASTPARADAPAAPKIAPPPPSAFFDDDDEPEIETSSSSDDDLDDDLITSAPSTSAPVTTPPGPIEEKPKSDLKNEITAPAIPATIARASTPPVVDSELDEGWDDVTPGPTTIPSRIAAPPAPIAASPTPRAAPAREEAPAPVRAPIALADDDDDEPEIETSSSTDDDDEPEIETSTIEAQEPAAPQKKPEERFVLVGDSVESLRAQKAMLLGIANSLRGTERAELLVSAAELADRAGDEDATSLLDDALVADPRHLVALRRARRASIVRGDHLETAKLLEREITLPLSPTDKSNALAWLTELHLGPLADPTAALKHARLALAAAKNSPHAQMYVAEASAMRGEDDDVAQSLEKIAEAASGRLGAHAAIDAALHAEHRQQTKRARELADRALTLSPNTFIEAFHGARLRRADGDVAGAIAALGMAAGAAPEGIEEHVRRAAAALALGSGTNLEGAYASLDPSTLASTARLRAQVARALGDASRERQAVEQWAERAKGTDRALALLRLAELTIEPENREICDTALRDAAVADPSFALVRVVRETIARRRGDAPDLVSEDENPLASLGRTVASGADGARQRVALEAAKRTSESPLLCDLLEGDIAAALADAPAARAAADRDATRDDMGDKLGPDLARAMLALAAGDADSAGRTLIRATQNEDGLVAVRLLAFARPNALEPLAMREAEHSVGEVSAAACRLAAELAFKEGISPIAALERSLEEDPSYSPSAFWLEELGPRFGADPVRTLERLRHAATSEQARTRLSLAYASSDDVETLIAAMDSSPDDMSLRLIVACASSAPEQARTRAWSELVAAAGATRTGLEAASANAHAEGGAPGIAATKYRALRSPLLERALEDAEISAGEIARIAERRFQAVRDAADDASRERALVALADLDRHVRADYGSASLSLAGAREAAPDDVRILRALERHAMEHDRTETLIEIEADLARVVRDVPSASVHARVAMRLAIEASPDEPTAADEILDAIAARGTTHRTLLRAIEGLARERGDRPRWLDTLRKRAATALTEPERLELALRIAEHEEQLEGPGPSARTLKPASDALPAHPTASEVLASYLERAQDAHSAGEALEVASRAARVPGRIAALAYRAGVLWQEGARDFDRALACFERALAIDVAYLDAFERAASILTRREQFARLLALYDARIDAATEPQLLTTLLLAKATVAESLGDRSTARAALDRALTLDPDNSSALRRAGELAHADEDYRSAADAFIRLARVRQDRDELYFIFMTLGDIYDRHTPDPRRAEASFRRVLKLAPDDKEALDRLIAVLLGQGLVEPAVEALAELVKSAPNDPRVRKHKLALAATYERIGDPRRAEQTLEEIRRTRPTDLEIVTCIAELYRRENAQSALGMHLNRAAADYRKAIEERPADQQLWSGLAQCYSLRGRRDGTRCVAAASNALGLADPELAHLLDARGNVPGAGKAVREQEVEEQLCPRALPPAALSVFRLASEIFEKLMPFDAKAWRTEKIGGKDHPIRAEANRIAEWFGLSDVQVLVTSVAPRIFVPVSESPVTIVIGRELPSLLDDAERTFLLVRALEIAASGMSLALRNQPQQVAFAIHGLIRAFDPMHVADGADVAQLDKFANQITKLLGRKAKSDLGPLAIEMGGRAGFDAMRLAVSASELGDRIALLSTGSLPSGLSALLKLAGREVAPNAPAAMRVAAVRGMAESWGLVEFAASDAHFEARRLLGLDKV